MSGSGSSVVIFEFIIFRGQSAFKKFLGNGLIAMYLTLNSYLKSIFFREGLLMNVIYLFLNLFVCFLVINYQLCSTEYVSLFTV